MRPHLPGESTELELQQQIDACCQAFEVAWRNGRVPVLEEFVTRVPPHGQAPLLRELLILERGYRRDSRGLPLSDARMSALHPDLMPQFAEQLKMLREEDPDGADGRTATLTKPAVAQNAEPAIDAPKSSGSRDLHIRCPHCSNPVELLTDTPLENITCRTCGSTFSLIGEEDHTREAPTLKRIGRFELVARVGMGGFGTVWKARDTELDRTVAVKIPRKGQLRRDEAEQFFREARSAAQLRHPNIVPVHEVGRDGDTIFIVSDLIRGVSLSDWLSGATPNTQEVAQIMTTVADALHHAHQKGVIHRDLKPSNILLDDSGQPHIMDFGLAKREVGEITMTVEGNVLGTPAYMSPEQAAGSGHWTDRRTDIYSLGVILFRMLTGELPFRGNAQMQIHQRLNEDPPDPRKLNRYLPRDLCVICLKCLERDPNRRFATSHDMADELRRFLRNEPILSRPVSRVERVLRWAKRKPALATAAALTVFLAVAGPITVIVLTGLYQRQSQLLLENNRLISRNETNIRDLKGQRDDVRSQLDVWEGKANPWEFWLWPPKRDQPPRRLMIADVLDRASAALVQPLRDGKYDREKTARGFLGLAVLAESAGQLSEARDYFRLARDELIELRREHANQPRFAKALAESSMRLAKLDHETLSQAAADDLHSARKVYQQLATGTGADLTHQIDWLEAESAAALATSAEARDTHLKRVQEIHRALSARWPTQPDALYRLACYLTQTDPLLLPNDDDAEKPEDSAAGALRPTE